MRQSNTRRNINFGDFFVATLQKKQAHRASFVCVCMYLFFIPFLVHFSRIYALTLLKLICIWFFDCAGFVRPSIQRGNSILLYRNVMYRTSEREKERKLNGRRRERKGERETIVNIRSPDTISRRFGWLLFSLQSRTLSLNLQNKISEIMALLYLFSVSNANFSIVHSIAIHVGSKRKIGWLFKF